MQEYAVGSLIRARSREWVVLPGSNEDMLLVRPLGGTDREETGIHRRLEDISEAHFALPDPQDAGDFLTSQLLRDAVRLGFRNSAGPFRSFARLGCEPRPYQLVPLLMALKLDPVRLLVADDVGIGKTIEAGLIARELFDRGEVQRMAVLCPPHLAEQWQTELRDKFGFPAELVLPSTIGRLERGLGHRDSLFRSYECMVISTDFIKSKQHRTQFASECPELVIVDEAHTCASGYEGRGGRQQRNQLLTEVASNPDRHLILLTATPHSGNEAAFRSLLQLLDPDFKNLPEDLSGEQNERHRRRIAAHLVQRRRGDIRTYMETDTPFPLRDEDEKNDFGYQLSEPYRQLFNRILNYVRESVADQGGTHYRQRVRWWSALALLRSVASSPAAAVATLRNRAFSEGSTVEEVDEIGRQTVLDEGDEEAAEMSDVAPGADISGLAEVGDDNRRRLLDMAREAEALKGAQDNKLHLIVEQVKALLAEGYSPIIFCRFIPTAEYVAEELRRRLRNIDIKGETIKEVTVEAVTGTLPPDERQERVAQLAAQPHRVLVCTDCLSEGINLQESFNAVVHYDLSWNPTRHEQREGRVDRYGQLSPRVKMLTIYGRDNQIDGIVLDVLIKKHRTIRSSLGVSVPVPLNNEEVTQAIVEGILLRSGGQSLPPQQMTLPGLSAVLPQRKELYSRWDAAAERERRSRTMFAQEGIKVAEVKAELVAAREAVGSSADVARFTREALYELGATVGGSDVVKIDLSATSSNVRDLLTTTLNPPNTNFKASFAQAGSDVVYLTRTHPFVETLASYVLDTALDPLARKAAIASRCGVVYTNAVERRTTLLLLRFRYHITAARRSKLPNTMLVEDCQIAAFRGAPSQAQWLTHEQASALFAARPDKNVDHDDAVALLAAVTDSYDAIAPQIHQIAEQRGQELLESHKRVRTASGQQSIGYSIELQDQPDVLAIYVYVPANI